MRLVVKPTAPARNASSASRAITSMSAAVACSRDCCTTTTISEFPTGANPASHRPPYCGSIAAAGSLLGTRALQIFDETTCVVRATLRWTEFYEHESCGKCTPCREGTFWMVRVLDRLEPKPVLVTGLVLAFAGVGWLTQLTVTTGYVAAVLGLYGVATWRGCEVAGSDRSTLPQGFRQSPGGYRSFHYWRGGK